MGVRKNIADQRLRDVGVVSVSPVLEVLCSLSSGWFVFVIGLSFPPDSPTGSQAWWLRIQHILGTEEVFKDVNSQSCNFAVAEGRS